MVLLPVFSRGLQASRGHTKRRVKVDSDGVGPIPDCFRNPRGIWAFTLLDWDNPGISI